MTHRRALLVVDYAETRVGLNKMLAALASDLGYGVRVLLLARSAGDWWDQLGVGEPAVWDLVQSAWQAELPLPPVVAADLSDAEVIALAVRSFARELGLPERKVEVFGDSGIGQRRVLDLHAAALVAVLTDASAGTIRVDIRKVLGELSAMSSISGTPAHGRMDCLMAKTERPASPAAARRSRMLARRCNPGRGPRPARPSARNVASIKIAEWLRALYPPDLRQTDWIGSMSPTASRNCTSCGSWTPRRNSPGMPDQPGCQASTCVW